MNKTRGQWQGTRLRKYHIDRAIWTDYVSYFIWQIKYSKFIILQQENQYLDRREAALFGS